MRWLLFVMLLFTRLAVAGWDDYRQLGRLILLDYFRPWTLR